MFPTFTYEEIEKYEKAIENKEIVIFLFARPEEERILKEFEYIHYNSGRYCSIYAVGYSADISKQGDPSFRKVDVHMVNDWFYSAEKYVEFKNKLQDRIQWEYSGETEVLILQNNPGRTNVLDFRNYVAINIDKGIREGYIDSFQSFMEALVRSAQKSVTAEEAIRDVANSRISIKDAIAEAISDCKRVPKPVKKILTDRLFYRSSGNIHK